MPHFALEDLMKEKMIEKREREKERERESIHKELGNFI